MCECEVHSFELYNKVDVVEGYSGFVEDNLVFERVLEKRIEEFLTSEFGVFMDVYVPYTNVHVHCNGCSELQIFVFVIPFRVFSAYNGAVVGMLRASLVQRDMFKVTFKPYIMVLWSDTCV